MEQNIEIMKNIWYAINKFCYEHITGKSYDEYVDYLKDKGYAIEVTKDM